MAKPIELGLVLEGEDAKESFRNEINPVVSEKPVGMFKCAKKINEKNGFSLNFYNKAIKQMKKCRF